MKTSRQYSFDEEKLARHIIENGFPNKKIDFYSMQRVAKYYREILGYGKIRLEREIINFCKQQDPEFNPVLQSETIKNWIKSAMNYKLIKINEIFITHSEMESIQTIKNLKDRKILFATLVLAKAIKKSKTGKEVKDSSNYYINYKNFGDIIKLSKIRLTEVGLADIFHEIEKYNLLKFYSPERESILLTFTNDNDKKAIIIKEPEQAMEYYTAYFGGDVIYCSNCGKEIIKKANAQKRCDGCAYEIKLKQNAASKKIKKNIIQ